MRRFLTIAEAANYVRTKPEVIVAAIAAGELPHAVMGEDVVLERFDVQKWFRSLKHPQPEPRFRELRVETGLASK